MVWGTRWWRAWLTLAPSCTATTERGPPRGRLGILLPAFVATKEEKNEKVVNEYALGIKLKIMPVG